MDFSTAIVSLMPLFNHLFFADIGCEDRSSDTARVHTFDYSAAMFRSPQNRGTCSYLVGLFGMGGLCVYGRVCRLSRCCLERCTNAPFG
jgi:hypothetical protein